MPSLTAKVFRTYNASITLDKLLEVTDGETAIEMIADYQCANKEVAILYDTFSAFSVIVTNLKRRRYLHLWSKPLSSLRDLLLWKKEICRQLGRRHQLCLRLRLLQLRVRKRLLLMERA